MGKGSSRRPTDDKKFSNAYDRIFGAVKKQPKINNKKDKDGISNNSNSSKIKKGKLRFNRGD